MKSEVKPGLSPTRTVLRCGSGFYTLVPGNLWREKGAYEIRYGGRILQVFPFWICFAFLVGHVPMFTQCILFYIESLALKITYAVLMGLAMVSYLLTHFTDPGMLPWTWADTRKQKYSSHELREGVATTPEQFLWAYSHPQPARCAFSRRYGYYVLRGDHDCWWVNNFIGINNHRHFLRSVWYSAILTIITDLTGLYVLRTHWSEMSWRTIIIAFCYQVPMNILGGVSVHQSYLQSRNVTKNVTLFELTAVPEALEARVWDNGCLRNWEEVCGSRWFLPCWLLPFPIPRTQNGFGYGMVDQIKGFSP